MCVCVCCTCMCVCVYVSINWSTTCCTCMCVCVYVSINWSTTRCTCMCVCVYVSINWSTTRCTCEALSRQLETTRLHKYETTYVYVNCIYIETPRSYLQRRVHIYIYMIAELTYKCTSHIQLVSTNMKLHIDRKKPPPPGGFAIFYVPSSRTVCKRTPLEEFVELSVCPN